jgi:hypothetical protein
MEATQLELRKEARTSPGFGRSGYSRLGLGALPSLTQRWTVTRIRKGRPLTRWIASAGAHLILAAQRWLAETKTLWDEGDFQGAMKTAAQLHEKISTVATAEGSLGTVSDARILKCSDVEVGMMLADVGEVTAVDRCCVARITATGSS